MGNPDRPIAKPKVSIGAAEVNVGSLEYGILGYSFRESRIIN